MPGAALLGMLSNEGFEAGKELFWLFMCQTSGVRGLARSSGQNGERIANR